MQEGVSKVRQIYTSEQSKLGQLFLCKNRYSKPRLAKNLKGDRTRP